MLVNREATVRKNHYTTSDVSIDIPDHDTDIHLKLPNGESITLQFRPEGNTVDICLPKNMQVHNWQGSDMKPAPKQRGNKLEHIRNADQLCVQLPPHSYDKVS